MPVSTDQVKKDAAKWYRPMLHIGEIPKDSFMTLADEKPILISPAAERFEEIIETMYQIQLATWTNKPITDVSFEEKVEKVKMAIREHTGTVLLESLCLTYTIENVPRSLTHQIVRARKLGFGQQAMRVDDVRHQPVRLPTTIEGSGWERDYKNMVARVKKLYADMIDSGIPIEDARNIMPLGTITYITVSGQLRYWLELWQGRAQKAAQNEYRVLDYKMLREFQSKMPRLFALLREANAIPEVWLEDLSSSDSKKILGVE